MASPDADILQLVHNLALGAKGERWINYMLVLSITLAVFDWLLTLDLEVPLVWGSPRSGTKLLFILTRYLAFIDVSLIIYYQLGYALPPHVCTSIYQAFTWMFVIGQFSTNAILTLRTWAVCGKSKPSTYGLVGAYGVSIALITVLFELYSRTSTFETSPIPRLFGCMAQNQLPTYLASAFVVLMFHDGGLLLLMIVQGVYQYRIAGKSQLTRVVFRDGILFYICIFVLSLLNAIIVFKLPDPNKTVLLPLERVAHSIVACRVVLHIREQAEVQKRGIMPSEQITGPLRFAQPGQRTTGLIINE